MGSVDCFFQSFADVARHSSVPFVLRSLYSTHGQIEEWAVRRHIDLIIVNTNREEVVELFSSRAFAPLEIFKDGDPFEKLRNLHFWKEHVLGYIIHPPKPYDAVMDTDSREPKKTCLACRRENILLGEGSLVCTKCKKELEPTKMPAWY